MQLVTSLIAANRGKPTTAALLDQNKNITAHMQYSDRQIIHNSLFFCHTFNNTLNGINSRPLINGLKPVLK